MFAHVESLVGGVYDDGIIREMMLIEISQESAYTLIHRSNHCHIVADIVLVFPFYQLLTREILAQEFSVSRHVIGINSLALLRCHAVHLSHESGIRVSAFRCRRIVHFGHFQVAYHFHIFTDSHLLGGCSRASGRIVVPEGFR